MPGSGELGRPRRSPDGWRAGGTSGTSLCASPPFLPWSPLHRDRADPTVKEPHRAGCPHSRETQLSFHRPTRPSTGSPGGGVGQAPTTCGLLSSLTPALPPCSPPGSLTAPSPVSAPRAHVLRGPKTRRQKHSSGRVLRVPRPELALGSLPEQLSLSGDMDLMISFLLIYPETTSDKVDEHRSQSAKHFLQPPKAPGPSNTFSVLHELR